MSFSKKLFRSPRFKGIAVIGGALFALAMLAAPQQAAAQACAANLNNSTSPVGPYPISGLPQLVDITASMGATGSVVDVHDIQQLRHRLDCSDLGTLDFASCLDGGAIVSFVAVQSTDCVDTVGGAVTWNASAVGNTVTFTPGDGSLAQRARVPLGSTCDLVYRVSIDSIGADSSPLNITAFNNQNGICRDLEGPSTIEVDASGGVLHALSANCDFVLDKQVACAGGPPVDVVGVDEGDPPDSTQSCDGWNAFPPSMPDAEPIETFYAVKNTGDLDLINCSIDDDNTALGIIAVSVDDIPATQTTFGPVESSMTAVAFDGLCSDTLDDMEPNTATLTCDCALPGETDPIVTNVSRSDTAAFACLTPGLNIQKTCDVVDNVASNSIDYQSTGTAALENCELTDIVADGECPSVINESTIIPATLIADPTAGVTTIDSGDFPALEFPLTETVCNTATITCDIVGTEKQISATDSATCEFTPPEECLTRTPGFWGTHPHITDLFLPIEVCGVEINTTEAGTANSSAEAMCVSGGEGKKEGRSPQYVSLVRALTAAKLNVAASLVGGGSCGDFEYTTDTDPVILNINDVIADCEALCGEDGPVLSECIDKLTAFNESEDTLDPFDDFVSPGPADPTECKEAKNNGTIVE